MRNRTADLLLTMETLYRLSYEGQPTTKDTQVLRAVPNRQQRHLKADLHPGDTKNKTGPESIRFGTWWQMLDSNQRRRCRRFYRPLPLAARATLRND